MKIRYFIKIISQRQKCETQHQFSWVWQDLTDYCHRESIGTMSLHSFSNEPCYADIYRSHQLPVCMWWFYYSDSDGHRSKLLSFSVIIFWHCDDSYIFRSKVAYVVILLLRLLWLLCMCPKKHCWGGWSHQSFWRATGNDRSAITVKLEEIALQWH